MAGRQDMSKIRINELARELEVKPNVILDMLPELGVAEKKTHSSSLDDDVVLALRQRLSGEPPPAPSEQTAVPVPSAAPKPASPAPASFQAEPATTPPPAAKEPEKETVADGSAILSRAVPPLRPPLATGSPIVPPVAPRGIPIPARPAPPPPKPGQILSGPRAPLPAAVSSEGMEASRGEMPRPSAPVPSLPVPPRILVRPPAATMAPGAPSSPPSVQTIGAG